DVRHEAGDVIHRLYSADGFLRALRRGVRGGRRGDQQRERGEEVAAREGALFILRQEVLEIHETKRCHRDAEAQRTILGREFQFGKRGFSQSLMFARVSAFNASLCAAPSTMIIVFGSRNAANTRCECTGRVSRPLAPWTR